MGKKTLGIEETRAIRSALLDHQVLIAWKPEYELGIPIIDEQHRGIVTTINSLYHAIRHQHGESVLKPIIGMIHEYTRIHFEIEEDYLGKCNFSEREFHQGLHVELINKLTQVGEKSLWTHDPYPFLKFLKDWWIYHICDKDRIFRDYLLMDF